MPKSFTLVQLRYFTVVARTENMRAAPLELNVTQSTLSAAIHQLEREVGVELFHRRSSRRLRLTAEGRRLMAGARTLLEDADQRYQSVRTEHD
jgi:DNA-binding transcriptional LysR family regulator